MKVHLSQELRAAPVEALHAQRSGLQLLKVGTRRDLENSRPGGISYWKPALKLHSGFLSILSSF